MVQQRNAMHEGPEGRTSWGIAEMEWRPAWEAGTRERVLGKPALPWGFAGRRAGLGAWTFS